MPRQFDSSLLNAQVTNNPTTNISFSSLTNIIQDFANLPEITLQAIETAINDLLGYIDQVTGLNLQGLATALEGLFGSGNLLTGLLSFILGTGTTLGGASIIPAVQTDSTSFGSIDTGSPTSFTSAHTCAQPPNTELIVDVSITTLTAISYAGGTTVTYNGVQMNSPGFVNIGDGTGGWLQRFQLDNPAGGDNNIVVTPPYAVQSIIVSGESFTACSGVSGFVSAATDAVSQGITVQTVANGRASFAFASAVAINPTLVGATTRTTQNVANTPAGNLVVGDAAGGAAVTVTAQTQV